MRKITPNIHRLGIVVSMGSWESRFLATLWWYWKENSAVLERFHRKVHKRKPKTMGGGICWIHILEERFKRNLMLKVSNVTNVKLLLNYIYENCVPESQYWLQNWERRLIGLGLILALSNFPLIDRKFRKLLSTCVSLPLLSGYNIMPCQQAEGSMRCWAVDDGCFSHLLRKCPF